MSSPNRKRLKLTEMRDQALDSLGMEPGLELELDNGGVILVPNPLLLDEEAQSGLKDATEASALAKLLLGEEQHARLLAGGGRSTDVQLALVIMKEELAANPKLQMPTTS
ncbi:hypothetical protein [Kutzneria albida]|uniref:Uncharacterized protein n=1 Tax=Kutzneria albida DSM 43870 TaxID=1449976 RepID=W5WB12_9PSEU|nr:hypothetical protein [Kutzneria albida]AHH98333.1 hypothetical protein KALB_4971 [Kutzneria albida DSM 43870]